MSNTFGDILRITTFGESHGPAMGGIIDGFPAGIHINLDEVQRLVDRRRPGQSVVTTARDEKDRVEVLSGMLDGMTLGTPIGFIVRNTDQRSADYDALKDCYRPGHADYTYTAKYGIRDHRGAGRASARETLCRVVAGAFAQQALRQLGIEVTAYASQIGDVKLKKLHYECDLSSIEQNAVRCPDESIAQSMIDAISKAKEQGDTLGGIVTCVAQGVPAGLGDPVFDKLHAQLASAMMGIPAAKGFEVGTGFGFASCMGSEVLDAWTVRDGKIGTITNHSGGIQGGISNGEPIVFNVAFKPVATLMRPVACINAECQLVEVAQQGRHDPCVVPRAVPVVEAMAALVILDNYLKNKATRI